MPLVGPPLRIPQTQPAGMMTTRPRGKLTHRRPSYQCDPREHSVVIPLPPKMARHRVYTSGDREWLLPRPLNTDQSLPLSPGMLHAPRRGSRPLLSSPPVWRQVGRAIASRHKGPNQFRHYRWGLFRPSGASMGLCLLPLSLPKRSLPASRGPFRVLRPRWRRRPMPSYRQSSR
jgi:hypothetical protein